MLIYLIIILVKSINLISIIKSMDKIDIDIIKILNSNTRKSFRFISRELKLSISTISNRVKLLEEEGIIEGYIPLINREKIGYHLTALINIKLANGKLIEVQQQIAKNNQVSEVYDITGEWDSLIIAHFQDIRDLNKFIKKILSMECIERTNTQMVLNIVKNEKRVEI
jgi:DNA-binding Lrp family transcriptional regulator